MFTVANASPRASASERARARKSSSFFEKRHSFLPIAFLRDTKEKSLKKRGVFCRTLPLFESSTIGLYGSIEKRFIVADSIFSLCAVACARKRSFSFPFSCVPFFRNTLLFRGEKNEVGSSCQEHKFFGARVGQKLQTCWRKICALARGASQYS